MAEELISRQALMAAFRKEIKKEFPSGKCVSEEDCKTCIMPCLWREVVISAPAVDAVEVVRCKDCKYAMLLRKPESKLIADCYIRIMYSDDRQFCMVGENDFCSYGERRE